MESRRAIVIGAGIVGLATARALAEKGYQVTVFERNEKAIGASIRNFGMVWLIGQTDGKLFERGLRSKVIWKQVCQQAGLWLEETGSLHLAYHQQEWQVMNEVAAIYRHRNLKTFSKEETIQKSPAVNPNNLIGALWSPHETIIESRVAIAKLPAFLFEKYGVQFHFNTVITSVEYPLVKSNDTTWQADQIFVCSGADFETLYPELYMVHNFTKCKLQMMRLAAQPNNWRIGPPLCGGLSLLHYKSFEGAASLPALRKYFEAQYAHYLKCGIHVMVSQNGEGELTIGDSHEYGNTFDPFDRAFINQLIIDYMKGMANFKNWAVTQSWNGVYAKRTNGATEFIHSPEPGVTIINGLGGSGMTLSFGLAEEVVASL